MAPQEIFGAREHIDKNEGKGDIKVVGWFTTRQEAEKLSAELPGVSGARNDLSVEEAVLYETAEEHPDYNEAEAARQRRIRELRAELAALESQGN